MTSRLMWWSRKESDLIPYWSCWSDITPPFPQHSLPLDPQALGQMTPGRFPKPKWPSEGENVDPVRAIKVE